MAGEELKYVIALGCLYTNNARKVRSLIEASGSAQKAWERVTSATKTEALVHAEREMTFIAKHGIKVYYYKDTNYPVRLKGCSDAPVLLFGKGQLEINAGKFVSIVGTRGASERGKDVTRRLVLDLAAKVPDVTIVSGLAYGIDVAAHRAALEAGLPTIIVPAHGLDRVYPSVHRQVAVEALAKGGILTEYPSETEPEKLNFVARNRIVAGLADAVVVVESKIKGGALITAYLAGDYNRNLYAFPGRPQDVLSQGCNALIKNQRAVLIENADDLIRDMQWEAKRQAVQTEIENLFMELDELEMQLVQILRAAEDGKHVNDLVEETGIAYSQIATTLMMLEMKGLVKEMAGSIYRAVR